MVTTRAVGIVTVVRIQVQITRILAVHQLQREHRIQTIQEAIQAIAVAQVTPVVLRAIIQAAVVAQVTPVVLRVIIQAVVAQVTPVALQTIIQVAAVRVILVVHRVIAQEAVAQVILVVLLAQVRVQEVAVDHLPLIREVDKITHKKRASFHLLFFISYKFHSAISLSEVRLLIAVLLPYL